MARTPLGPWTFVRDMGSLSQCGLSMTSGQEANDNNLGNFCFCLLDNDGMLRVLIRIISMRQF